MSGSMGDDIIQSIMHQRIHSTGTHVIEDRNHLQTFSIAFDQSQRFQLPLTEPHTLRSSVVRRTRPSGR